MLIHPFLLLLLPTLSLAKIFPLAPNGDTLPQSIQSFFINPQFLSENKDYYLSGLKGLNPAINRIFRYANASVQDTSPYSVTAKASLPIFLQFKQTYNFPPFAANISDRDFFSLARYFWPNATFANLPPSQIIYSRFDGFVNPEIYLYPDYQVFKTVLSDIYNCALAFFFSGNESYAASAASRIQSWFLDPTSGMIPSLEYSNVIKGPNGTFSPASTAAASTAGGLLDMSPVYQLVDALNILKKSQSFTPSQYTQMASWLSTYYTWTQTSPRSKAVRDSINNQGTWHDVQTVSILLFLNRTSDAENVLRTITIPRMQLQFAAGTCHQPLELTRTRSWFYSLFNLQGLYVLSTLAESTTVDLFNTKTDTGCTIQSALDYHLPFARNNGSGWPALNMDNFDPSIALELSKMTWIKTRDVKYKEWVDGVQVKPRTWNPSRLWAPYSAYDVPVKNGEESMRNGLKSVMAVLMGLGVAMMVMSL